MHLTVFKTYVGLLVNYIQLSYGARMGESFYTLWRRLTWTRISRQRCIVYAPVIQPMNCDFWPPWGRWQRRFRPQFLNNLGCHQGNAAWSWWRWECVYYPWWHQTSRNWQVICVKCCAFRGRRKTSPVPSRKLSLTSQLCLSTQFCE